MANNAEDYGVSYCAECKSRLKRTAGGDFIYCCPVEVGAQYGPLPGVDREEDHGNIIAFESSNGNRFRGPLLPLDLATLKEDTRELLRVVMQKFEGAAWERDVLGSLRMGWNRYCAALTDVVFRREGYKASEGSQDPAFRIYVTDLAFDAWNSRKGGKR